MYTYLDYILYILMSLNFDLDFRSFSKPSTKNQYQNSIPFVKQTSQVVIFPKIHRPQQIDSGGLHLRL